MFLILPFVSFSTKSLIVLAATSGLLPKSQTSGSALEKCSKTFELCVRVNNLRFTILYLEIMSVDPEERFHDRIILAEKYLVGNA